ncbi:MAG: ABC transporter ATP-binding protein [Halobacteriovoraceae bacterium]|jgi:peptide/nickel transport system ATP-binding protein|nr:ABC transporter ATP-binding protein [Halobacteriovoraceae bacterium]
MSDNILEVKNLAVEFNTDRGKITAVNGVNLELAKGKTLGVVGESGSGKSVTALSIMGLIPNPPGRVAGGEILYYGENLLDKTQDELRKVRGNKIAMIFQEPMTSLNPVFTVGNQIEEVVALHQSELDATARKAKAVEMLHLVGIPSPEKRVDEYPHQLSGGMRQRVMIAMSLACNPDILIADEPTTALDVTIQAQILDLMNKLQKERGMGIIFITHDLGVVAEMCDDVAVMYCGKIVEKADVKTLFKNPRHPYTKGLIDSIPSFDSTTGEKKGRLPTIEGMVPSLFELPQGCNFQNRCSFASEQCRGSHGDPELNEIASLHEVSCFHPLS